MKEYFGWVLDRAQAKELLSPWSWALPPSLQVDMLSNSEGLCALLFMGILWRFHHWLSHWQLVSTLNLQSLFCPKRLGVWSTWVFHLFSHMVGSSGNQLPSWSSLGAHPGHLIKKYSDTISKCFFWETMKYFFHLYHLNISKGLGSSVSYTREMSKWRYLTVSQFSCWKFIFLHCKFCVHASTGLRLQLAEFRWTSDFSLIIPSPIV